MRTLLIGLMLVCLAACHGGRRGRTGDLPGERDGGAGGGGDGSVGMDAAVRRDGGGGGVDGGGGGSDAGGGRDAGAPHAFCQRRCAAAADCTSDTPAYDLDNYRCSDDLCEYPGCHDDAECQASLAADYVCREAGADYPVCVRGCSTASDCSTASAAYDTDNWECRSGACVYAGCNDDAECQSSHASTAYGCRDVGGDYPLCTRLCDVVADCVSDSAAYDADNWECRSGVCVYAGCNDDAECQSSHASTDYVCR